MILEIAEIDVKPAKSEEFEAGVVKARELFLKAPGCHGMKLYRSVEHPLRYRLFVQWETLEHHIRDFRTSESFGIWRSLVQEYFSKTPSVEHQLVVIS